MAMQQVVCGEAESGDVSMVAMFNYMQLIHAELVKLKNSNAKFQASLSVDRVNNKIMALQQEIAELNATTKPCCKFFYYSYGL